MRGWGFEVGVRMCTWEEQVEASSGVEETELKAKIAALQSETRKTPAASTSQMSEVCWWF